METIRSMKIDEEKQYRLYTIRHQNKQINKIYSNCNTILVNIDFIKEDLSKKKKVIRRKGLY